ncbi:MAG: flavodoxin family protein [Lachnospirales bacterium]
MKVLLINGSPKGKGSTFSALSEVCKIFIKNAIEWEILSVGREPIRDCIGCGKCRELKKCAFNDVVNEIAEKAQGFDGFVFGTPVYYAHPTGSILALLDRLFYANSINFRHKPAAAIAVARRAGAVASIDVINKYFTISEMPIVSARYWNGVYGRDSDDVPKDDEGMENMRILGENMTWMLKCIDLGKRNNILPPVNNKEKWTHFIR